MAIPKPTSNEEGGPFLKTMHISQKGKTKLLLVGPASLAQGQYGEQILIPAKIGKKEYTFAVTVDSGNHSRLYARFGNNERKWKGVIQVQIAEHLDKQYIQVAD